jgi:ABC-2 type transport system ATP-binding protein
MNSACPLSVQYAVKTAGTPAVELKQLAKNYADNRPPALDGVDLIVPHGVIFGILGPNGAGKTTLLSILSSLLKPSSGSASINGYDVQTERDAIRRIMGMVPQEPAVYPTLTARENLEYFGRMQALTGARLDARVKACLELAELGEVADQRVEYFSGGFRRRLNLVIGLIHEPKILILDEPTVAIDPRSRALIHQRLRELHDAGITILLSTHYLEEAEKICQSVAIMNHGRILIHGMVGTLLAEQRDDTVQIQLDEDPPPGLLDAMHAIPGLTEANLYGRCLQVWSNRPDRIIAPVMDALEGYDIRVESLTFGTVSLERLFLSLTGDTGAVE